MKYGCVFFLMGLLSGCMPIGMLPEVNYIGMTREQVLEKALQIERDDENEVFVIECYEPNQEIVILDWHGEPADTFSPESRFPQSLSFKTNLPIAEDTITVTEKEILAHTSRWNLNFRYRMAFWGVGYHYCIEIEFDSLGRVSKQSGVRRYFL